MQRIDGAYLYRLGSLIHPIVELGGSPASYIDTVLKTTAADAALEGFLTQSIFQPRYSQQAGQVLLNAMRGVTAKLLNKEAAYDDAVDADLYSQLINSAFQFEILMASEFAMTALYLVSKKGGYDIADLIERGDALFSTDLGRKVPEALSDIQQATRCLAFELPTVSGFHIHRANESVLHAYFDAVTGGAARPKSRNMGDYLTELTKMSKGDPKVISALKDLKDLHRNPLIHSEHSLSSVDEAIDLIGAVRTVIGYMLREIPERNEAQE